MARPRKRLRIEPYKPDAVDADWDGIVQEGTAWERPRGTRIIDEAGEEIKRGAIRGFDAADATPIRFIDADGNEVEYRQTWKEARKQTQRRPLGRTLAERGAPSLASRQESLGQRFGNLGDSGVPDLIYALDVEFDELPDFIDVDMDRGDIIDARREWWLQTRLAQLVTDLKRSTQARRDAARIHNPHAHYMLDWGNRKTAPEWEQYRNALRQAIAEASDDDERRALQGELNASEDIEKLENWLSGQDITTEDMEAVADVAAQTQARRAQPEQVTPEATTPRGVAYRKAVADGGGVAFDQIQTDRDAYEQHVERAKEMFKGTLFRAAKTREQVVADLDDEEFRSNVLQNIDKEINDSLTPEEMKVGLARVKQRLEAGETVSDLAREAARKWAAEINDEDTQVRVDFSSAILDDIIDAGAIVSSADERAVGASSKGGTGSERIKYEAVLGVPMDAPSSARPVSGYVVPGREHRERFGPDGPSADPMVNPELVPDVQKANKTRAGYGDAHAVIRRDVARERTAIGNGDSISQMVVPAPIDQLDEASAMDALFNNVGFTGMRQVNGTPGPVAKVLAWANGDDPRVSSLNTGGMSYVEALTFGNVGIEDMAEIHLPEGYDEPFTDLEFEAGSGKRLQGGTPFDEGRLRSAIAEALFDEDFTADLDPEIRSLLRSRIGADGGISDEVKAILEDTGAMTTLKQMVRLQKRDRIRARLKEKGFTGQVVFAMGGPIQGLDLENPNIPAYNPVRERKPATGKQALGMMLGDKLRGATDRIRPSQTERIATPPTPQAPDGDPLRVAGAPGTPEGIDTRNYEVAEIVARGGGSLNFSALPFADRQAFIERESEKLGGGYRAEETSGRDWVNILRSERLEEIEKQIEKGRRYIVEEQERGRTGESFKTQIAELERIREYLEGKTEEELADEIIAFVRTELDDDETRIAVQITQYNDSLNKFIEEGYKTTHTTRSPSSDPQSRAQYELTQGIPADTPPELRPASGYMIFGSRRRAALEYASQGLREGEDPEATNKFRNATAGKAAAYGGVQAVLKPGVKGRSTFGMGDTLNDGVRSAPLIGATDDQILDSLFAHDGGKGEFKQSHRSRFADMISMLSRGEPALMGGQSGSRFDDHLTGGKSEETGYNVTRYFEALIFGSFDITDVEELSLDESIHDYTVPSVNVNRSIGDVYVEVLDDIGLDHGLTGDQYERTVQLLRMAKARRLRDAYDLRELDRAIEAYKQIIIRREIRDRIASKSPDTKVIFQGAVGEYDDEALAAATQTLQEQFLELYRALEAAGEETLRSDFEVGLADDIDAMSADWTEIETKASSARLRLQPYDPDAKDADGDGIVQEGTAWERPAGWKILDEFGEEIAGGRILGRVPDNITYVNEKGEKDTYTPKPPEQDTPDGRTSSPAISGLPTLGEMARGQHPDNEERQKPKPPPAPKSKVPEKPEDEAEKRAPGEILFGTPEEPIEWEELADIFEEEGFQPIRNQWQQDMSFAEFLEELFSPDGAFHTYWINWNECREIRQWGYRLSGTTPGSSDPNLTRTDGYFGVGLGYIVTPEEMRNLAIGVMALIAKRRRERAEGDRREVPKLYRAVDVDDLDEFLEAFQEGEFVDIPLLATAQSSEGEGHVANLTRYGTEVLMEIQDADGHSNGEMFMVYSWEDELDSLDKAYDIINQNLEDIREILSDGDLDPDEVRSYENQQRDLTEFLGRLVPARARLRDGIDGLDDDDRDFLVRVREEIASGYYLNFREMTGHPYRVTGEGMVADSKLKPDHPDFFPDGDYYETLIDSLPEDDPRRQIEVVTGGRFEVVSVDEETDPLTPYSHRIVLKQVGVFDPVNPGRIVGEIEEVEEFDDRPPTTLAEQTGDHSSLPLDPDTPVPAALFDDWTEGGVNALAQTSDQTRMRHLVTAFWEGDFSWVLEWLQSGYGSVASQMGFVDFGDDEEGLDDVTLADVRAYVQGEIEQARDSIQNYDGTRDGKYIFVWRGGRVGDKMLVSVAADDGDDRNAEEIAAKYGDAYRYRIPVDAVYYEEPDGESGEFLVDASRLELIDKDGTPIGPLGDREDTPFSNFMRNLFEENIPGWIRTDEDKVQEAYRAFENQDPDDEDAMSEEDLYEQLRQFELEARQELYARLAEVASWPAADALEAWIEGMMGTTYSMREDVVRGEPRARPLLELIDASDEVDFPLYRGMQLSEEQVKEMLERGRINFPIGATSTSSSSAAQYGPVMFRIEGAQAFPAHYFSPIDEEEWLVSGEFEIVEVGSFVDRMGNDTGKTLIVVRPTGRNYLDNQEQLAAEGLEAE